MLTNNKNFNRVLKLLEQEIKQDNLIELLKNGNDSEKQVAALKINTVQDKNEALILSKNLIGQDGKIREVVAFKINELIINNYDKFADIEFYNILLNAVIDVNSNVCRNIINIISKLKSNPEFCDFFVPKLINNTYESIKIVNKFDFQDGKYKINKEVFKLYWYLETIYQISDKINIENIKSIIIKTKNIAEYTIREKTAKILSRNFNDTECKQYYNELKNDVNYYVRRI